MIIKKTKNGNTTATIAFLLSCIFIVSVIVFEKTYWGNSLFKEGWPIFSASHIIRSIIIFISILFIVLSLIGSSRPKLILSERNGISFELLSIVVVLFISVIFLLLFIFEPSLFNDLSREDNLIEWGSAIFLFVSCFITAFSFFKSRGVLNISSITRLSLALSSLVFFVMAMEEVSWFQRVLVFETPKILEGNHQHEMNLHNFGSNYFENLYYFGGFVFLVVLPFIRSLFPYISKNNYLKILVPRPFIVVIGSIACAYNFDMWNIIFIQITFFGSLVILCAFAAFSSVRNERYTILFTIALVATTQMIFLSTGKNFDRLWAVTEYKELLIPLGLFIYSLDVFIQINRVNLLEKSEQ